MKPEIGFAVETIMGVGVITEVHYGFYTISSSYTVYDGEFEILTGRLVEKNSGKPFKSGRKYNTVKSYRLNPYTGRAAFTFEEDDSIVECRICNFIGD